MRTEKSVFCIVDDTISSKTKPSLWALQPIEDAMVLLDHPKKAFGKSNILQVFLYTDVSLSTDEILSCNICRWPIEVFFR